MYNYATIIQISHYLLIVHQTKHFTAIRALGASWGPIALLAPDKLRP